MHITPQDPGGERPRWPTWDVVIVGGGVAGLSAAIYLARSRRGVLVVDSGRSLAHDAPCVENYLGFPENIHGDDLLERGRRQARRFGAGFGDDTVAGLRRAGDGTFLLRGRLASYRARRVLLATGLHHLPPDLPGASECIGHSLFFCKDCDGLRCEGQRIGIFGWNDEAADYALAMLAYSLSVCLFTHGKRVAWNADRERWLKEYGIPIHARPVVALRHTHGRLQCVEMAGGREIAVDAIFATRGDVIHDRLAKQAGARCNDAGEIAVDEDHQTDVPGLYGAGCATPANCQMIVAAGEGAAAAQSINRSLFEESLRSGALRRRHTLHMADEIVHRPH